MKNKQNILVLAGGFSEEREISLATAEAVFSALERLKYNVRAIDAATGKSLLDDHGKFLLEEDKDSISKIALKSPHGLALTESISSGQFENLDLIFIALHGGAGENGTIQALLDLAGIKYTGSGMLASGLAMNKAITKKLVKYEDIPTPGSMLLLMRGDINLDREADSISDKFTYPLIVKPNNSGSTVGLSLVKDKSLLIQALKAAADISEEILIEQFIKGREITASVFEGESFPLVEIIPSGELYDYQCKYTKGKSEYICPANLPGNIENEIKEYAEKAYNIIGCSGLVRVDFILDERNKAWFLEVNTIPGMTELSLAPMAAGKAGISFDELIEKICRSALDS